MLVCTTDSVPGYMVAETYGLVIGNVVATKNVGRAFAAGLKSIVGGELRGYTELLDEARNTAVDRMVREAQKLGANAVIGMRMTTSDIMDGASEVMAYGTAVKIVPVER